MQCENRVRLTERTENRVANANLFNDLLGTIGHLDEGTGEETWCT